jgi:ketopantoate hydroxymethyltransferase
MIEDYEEKKRKQISLMRSILDYGIGAGIIAFGLFLFFRDMFELEFNEKFKPNFTDKLIAIVFVLYGSWRIYRGYKKNYFK